MLEIIIISIIQGITEFIPVSSSSHLIIVSKLFNYSSSILLDVSVHIGSFIAVIIYFRKDLVDFFNFIGRKPSFNHQLPQKFSSRRVTRAQQCVWGQSAKEWGEQTFFEKSWPHLWNAVIGNVRESRQFSRHPGIDQIENRVREPHRIRFGR